MVDVEEVRERAARAKRLLELCHEQVEAQAQRVRRLKAGGVDATLAEDLLRNFQSDLETHRRAADEAERALAATERSVK